jgi:hypothetical protein
MGTGALIASSDVLVSSDGSPCFSCADTHPACTYHSKSGGVDGRGSPSGYAHICHIWVAHQPCFSLPASALYLLSRPLLPPHKSTPQLSCWFHPETAWVQMALRAEGTTPTHTTVTQHRSTYGGATATRVDGARSRSVTSPLALS